MYFASFSKRHATNLSWEQRKLGEVSERVQGNDGRMDLPTLTISAANGWMSQEDRFSGNIAGKEQKNYTLLHKGELSYNHGNSKLAKYGTVFSLESYEEALVPRVYHSFRMIDADASFIEYYFSTKIPDRELAKLISSGARMDGLLNISFDEFMGIKINLPSIQEQQKISYYLRQLDNLITLHQCKHNYTPIAFALQKTNNSTPSWEQRKFVSVFDGLQNNTLSRAELNYESGTIKNVHYGDVLIKFGDYIDASQTELPYISDDAKADKFKNSFLQDGDIIIADTAEDDTVGKCTEIRGSEGMKLLSGLHTIACRPKEKYGPMFLGYYINSPAYHNQLKPLMQGIKVTSISKSALQDTDMIIPKSIDEQIKIGEYFSNLDNLITLHQR
ncbi:MAG: restriction endonuclease subunit S [Butyrivibrio sp.]|uniref:restriction endonuclease subunit S n=1 Tax=Butyrivibrio sp. TaxID=28121 RepID=UPI001B4B4F75|nr:restriction endonuclease subunit S [Butyrivibrio sp.]MBP3783576.1 restriction endonuclease subunit S [Butyrivibrio sp.]